MDFFATVKNRIDNQAKITAVSSYSFIIETNSIKIHYVTVVNFEEVSYRLLVQNLIAQYAFFVTIFEDQFNHAPSKIIERLNYHSGKSIRIHGRNTQVEKIDKPTAFSFLEKNHSNVALKAKYNFALKDKNGQFVAVACFGQVIRMRSGSISSELIRFCNLSGTRVVGGLTKLISHFQKVFELDELMTYCDLEWSDGSNFTNLDFSKISTSAPTRFVINLNTWERTHIAKPYKNNASTQLNQNDVKTVENLGSIKFIKYFND